MAITRPKVVIVNCSIVRFEEYIMLYKAGRILKGKAQFYARFCSVNLN